MEKSLALTGLAEWLRNPIVHVHVTDEIEVERLRERTQLAEQRAIQAESRYQQELVYNLRLQDILRKYGINER